MKPPEKVNIADKFTQFSEQWQPKIAGQVDDYYVKLAKLEGEFIWHQHDEQDELFLVMKGQLLIKLRDGEVVLNEGEFVVIPAGVEHLPIAEKEAHVLFFEHRGTLNTGNQNASGKTVRDLDTI